MIQRTAGMPVSKLFISNAPFPNNIIAATIFIITLKMQALIISDSSTTPRLSF